MGHSCHADGQLVTKHANTAHRQKSIDGNFTERRGGAQLLESIPVGARGAGGAVQTGAAGFTIQPFFFGAQTTDSRVEGWGGGGILYMDGEE